MKDPLRLLDCGATDDERALLSAAIAEEPPDEGRQRLAATLGLTSGIFNTAAGAGSTHVASSALKTAASKIGLLWISVLAAVGVVVVLVTHAAPRATNVSGAGANVVIAPRPPTAAPATLDAPKPMKAAPASSSTAETQAEPSRSSGSRAKGALGDREQTNSIAGEIERLDVARRALGDSRPRDALRALSDYDARYPAGALKQEATLLRIEALSAAGDLDSARRIGDRFLRDNPRTPHEQRIRTAIRETR